MKEAYFLGDDRRCGERLKAGTRRGSKRDATGAVVDDASPVGQVQHRADVVLGNVGLIRAVEATRVASR